ncbi:MAG: Hsp20/alpha crystallin family protein [bacterium]
MTQIKNHTSLEEDIINWMFQNKPSNKLTINIEETEKDYIIKANCQGFKKDEITITNNAPYLHISASTKKETPDKKYLLEEFTTHRTCERSLNIGYLNPENIDASFENEILKITIRKVKKEENKIIKIK